MFEIFRQSVYFLYRNYLYFLPVLLVFSFITLLAAPSPEETSSMQNMEEILQMFVNSGLFLLPLAYILIVLPLLLSIVKRRLYQPDESVLPCLAAAFINCWRVVFNLAAVILIIGGAVYLIVNLITLILPNVASSLVLLAYISLIYASIRLSLLIPILVEDRTGPLESIRTCYKSTTGRVLKVVIAYAMTIGLSIAGYLLVGGLAALAGPNASVFAGGFVDANLNLLLMVVFYRMYLLVKGGDLDQPED